MANMKISELPAATSLSGLVVAGVQGGVNVRVPSSLFNPTSAPPTSSVPSGGTIICATRTALKIADTTMHQTAILTEGSPAAWSRAGSFRWDSTVAIATHRADTLEGWYVAPNAGAIGAWVRNMSEGTYAHHAGAVSGTGQNSLVRDTNRAAIQAAIDMSVGNFRKGAARLAAGQWEYTGTLHLGWGQSFYVLRLEGDGRHYRGAIGENGPGTVLVHIGPITDPAINVQGGRDVKISGISLKGALYDTFQAFTSADHLNEANWNAPGGNSRYAPYAGITLDAYSGTRPSPSYSDVTYPAWTGITTQWGRSLSSGLVVEDCSIWGFNTCFVTQPSGGDGNGDFVAFRDCDVGAAKYIFSYSHTQARNNRIENVQFGNCWIGITTKTHGLQNGRFDGYVSGFSGLLCANFLDCNVGGVFGYGYFVNCYCELMWTLGSIGTSGSAVGHIVFDQCSFTFDLQGDVAPGAGQRPGYILRGTSFSPVEFRGGALINFASAAAFQPRNITTSGVRITSAERDGGAATLALHKAFFQNGTCGGVVFKDTRRKSFEFVAYNCNTGLVYNSMSANSDSVGNFTRIFCIPQYVWRYGFASESTGRLVNKTGGSTVWDKASLSSMSYVAGTRTLTIVFTSLPDSFALSQGPLPGDHILDDNTGTVFTVFSRVGTTVKAIAENNINIAGGGFLIAVSMTAGILTVFNNRLYAPNYALLGDTTAGSATIANVARRDGYGGFIETDIAVGDMLADDFEGQRRAVAYSAATIVSRSNAGATIGLSGSASITVVDHPLDLFIRTGPANI